MSLLVELGFVVGMALLSVIALAAVSDRVDRALTRLALLAFRDRVKVEGRHRKRRSRALQSVHAPETYPAFASKTLLLAAMVGVAGSLVPVFLVQRLLVVTLEMGRGLRASVPPEFAFLVPVDVAAPSLGHLFVMLLASGATVGVGGAALTYHARWWAVASEARRREVLIDESLARTVAFVYALSRSGMLFPEVMRTVAANRYAFGESAEEIGVVVKDMDLFGADLVTALQRTAARTPSERFADFAENFANVLHSGQNVSAYLHEQYEQFQDERVANQERLLELFTAIGEAYVAGLVAGPLFFITILVVFGVLNGGILEFLQLVVYLFVPLANAGFVVYLGGVAEPLASFAAPIRGGTGSRGVDVRRVGDPGTSPGVRSDGGEPRRASRVTSDWRSDGGERTVGSRASSGRRPDGGVPPAGYDPERNRRHLAAYRRVERLREALLDPFETVVRRPATVLVVAVPAAVLLLVARAWPMLAGAADPSVAALDDLVIQSGLVVVVAFAAVHEVHTRRLRRVDEAVPDLLDRLASTNDAGMTFTESLRRVDRSDLGALNVEVERLLADVNWGARTERALERFNERIGSSTVQRVTALLTNAMLASGHLGPVIRIAAEEAREDRRLVRQRRQEMFMYVLIVYLSFVVFLGIAAALQSILIPAIPTTEQIGAAATSGAPVELPFDIAGSDEKAAYSLVLFHAAVVQAACSGFIAGQMAEGRVRDGAKHVAIMVSAAYVVFLVLL